MKQKYSYEKKVNKLFLHKEKLMIYPERERERASAYVYVNILISKNII